MTPAAGAWLAVLGCATDPPPSPAPPVASAPLAVPAPAVSASRARAQVARPDIVVITIETVRADHVGPLYGYPRETMPHLAALASQGVTFDQAIASSSWTLPSVSSVLTGVAPSLHGLVQVDRSLPAATRTVAQDLSAQGYQTAFIGVNPLFAVHRGLERGFDHWEALVGAAGGQLNQSVYAWWDAERDPSRPLYLHLHYFDPHCPYRPPRELESHFDGAADGLATGQEIPEGRWAGMGGCYRLTRADGSPETRLDVYLDAYDAELVHVDRVVSRLFDRLGPRGIDLGDLIVITADHGEAFWEHGDYGHGRTLWQESVRVPLVVRPPGGVPARREAQPVSTAQVAGLVRAVGGVPGAVDTLGVRGELARGPVFTETDVEGRRRRGAVLGGVKLIRDLVDDSEVIERVDGASAASADGSTAPARAALEAWLDQVQAQAPPAGQVELSAEQIQQLRALGYTL